MAALPGEIPIMSDSTESRTPDADFFMAALWDAARPAGVEIPGYEILGEISRGGMGVVYHARQERPDREVALKVLLPQFAEEPEMLARFQLEARAMAALDHPGILPVYEVGESDGMPYFSMRLADGGTLAERLRKGQLPVRDAAALMIQLARAVHHAHQHGVLHRDLKPGNFLFMEDGRACVSDFGLAKLTLSDQSPLTRTESFFGTPHYMPPEVATGSVADATVAGDLYSMGAVLYECLTGRRPHDGKENVTALLRAIADEAVQRPEEISKSIPRDLSVICMKALERSPRDRYATLEEFASDIERWLQGRPILARPVGAMESAWRWACRHPLPATLVGALVLVSTVGGILLSISHAQRGAALRDARAQLHRSLIEQARSERLLGNPGHSQRAMSRLRKAADISKTDEIRNEVAALVSRPDLLPRPEIVHAPKVPAEPLPDDPVMEWKPSADHQSWLAWHESGAVRWWRDGHAITNLDPTEGREIEAGISRDGSRAVFAETTAGVVMVDASGATRVLSNEAGQAVIRFVDIDPTSRRVALTGPNGLQVLGMAGDAGSWERVGEPARCAVAWSGDGSRLAVALGDQREVLVLGADEGHECAKIPTSAISEHLALDASGGLLAAATADGMMAIHDATDGMVFSSLHHRSQGLWFESPGVLRSRLDEDRGVWMDWFLERPFEVFQSWWEKPRAKSNELASCAKLSPDGRHLLTVSAGSAALWSVAGRRQTALIPLESQRVDDEASGWWLGNDAILLQVPGGLERVPVDAVGSPGKVEGLDRVPGAKVLEVSAKGDWFVQVMDEEGGTSRQVWLGGDPSKSETADLSPPPSPDLIEVRDNQVHVSGNKGRALCLTIPNSTGLAAACMSADGSHVMAVTKDHRVISWRVDALSDTLDAAGF